MSAPNRRTLPSIQELLDSPQLRQLVDRVSRHAVVSGAKSFLDNLRHEVHQAAAEVKIPTPSELADHVARWILASETPALRPVINGSGVLLPAAWGAAPLAAEAVTAIVAVAQGYAGLIGDPGAAEGATASREANGASPAVVAALTRLTGAESALVVGNDAAAVLLTLSSLAAGKNVLVARGQVVEIEGRHRLVDLFAASGARLCEVGSTNLTRLADYEAAIDENTAAILYVQPRDFVVVGSACQATREELVALGQRRRLPVIEDLGIGGLLDAASFGFPAIGSAPASLQAGVDLVLLAGDQLLGGPRCGVVAGRQDLVRRLAEHPSFAALRADKMTLAGLEATLGLYDDAAKARQSVPLLALLDTSPENLKHRAERLAIQLAASPVASRAEAGASVAHLSAGQLATQATPSWGVAVWPKKGDVAELAGSLRAGRPALIARVEAERLWIDLRGVLPSQDMQIVDAFEASAGRPSSPDSGDAESSAS